MQRSTALSVPRLPSENQIIIYQNTTIFLTQTIYANEPVSSYNHFSILFIVAAVVFLALGFLLGIGAMFVCSRRIKAASKAAKNSKVSMNDSQKSTAESNNG